MAVLVLSRFLYNQILEQVGAPDEMMEWMKNVASSISSNAGRSLKEIAERLIREFDKKYGI